MNQRLERRGHRRQGRRRERELPPHELEGHTSEVFRDARVRIVSDRAVSRSS